MRNFNTLKCKNDINPLRIILTNLIYISLYFFIFKSVNLNICLMYIKYFVEQCRLPTQIYIKHITRT